jgi:hypothetical protein
VLQKLRRLRACFRADDASANNGCEASEEAPKPASEATPTRWSYTGRKPIRRAPTHEELRAAASARARPAELLLRRAAHVDPAENVRARRLCLGIIRVGRDVIQT